jgi:hypothetical protein
MSREEWFDLPWYEVEVYLEGLRESGVLKGGGEKRQSDPITPPTADDGKALDLASASLDTLAQQTGVQTRRAG